MLMLRDATGIYTEQEPPRVYDPQTGAYRDTTGRIWNPELEAWQDVWPTRPEELVIYDHGDERVELAFINNKYYSYDSVGGYVYYAGFSTHHAIDMTKYGRLHMTVNIPTESWSGTVGISSASLPRVTDAVYPQITDIVGSGLRASLSGTGNKRDEYSIDLSGVDGLYYAYLLVGNSSGLESNAHVSMTKNADSLYFSGYDGRYQGYVYKYWLE